MSNNININDNVNFFIEENTDKNDNSREIEKILIEPEEEDNGEIRIIMSNINDHIFFFIEEKTEKPEENDNSCEIEKMLHELEEEDNDEDTGEIINYNLTEMEEIKNLYYSTKKMYDDNGMNNEELYEKYNIKQLLRICNYYDIEKNIKIAKYKKQDIIASIVYFESLSENFEIVNNRHIMWSYITELSHDSKMKKYIIW